jgi:AcrR family transcriptional regulator
VAVGREVEMARSAADVPLTGADRKRATIVDHAAELFDRSGYGNTSMADIAQAVQIAKPTLYHYFKSKDEILYSIHDEFINVLLSKHDARSALELSAHESLLELIVDIISLMQTHRGHVRVFFEHHRELPSKQQRLIRAKRDRFRQHLVDILERGVASGEFRDADTRLVAWAVLGMSNWTYQWFKPTGVYSARELAEQFFGIVTQGIQSPGTRTTSSA